MEAQMSRSISASGIVEDDFIESLPPSFPIALTKVTDLTAQVPATFHPTGSGLKAYLYRNTSLKNSQKLYLSGLQSGLVPASPWTTGESSNLIFVSAFHSGLVSYDAPFDFLGPTLGAGSVDPFFYIVLKHRSGLDTAVERLLSSTVRDGGRLARRLKSLHLDAIAEGETINGDSIKQLTDFFLAHSDLTLPKITMTPSGTIRVRWIQGKEHFTAIEFTGKPLAKFVAEIPRIGGLTARHFGSETLENIESAARAIGAWVS